VDFKRLGRIERLSWKPHDSDGLLPSNLSHDDPQFALNDYREWMCCEMLDNEVIALDRSRNEANYIWPGMLTPPYLDRPFFYPHHPRIQVVERSTILRILSSLGARAPGELGRYIRGLRLFLLTSWEDRKDLRDSLLKLSDKELLDYYWFIQSAWS
jgi:hypothetical protein